MTDRAAVLFLATLVGCWSAAGRTGELPDRKLSPGTVNAAISEQQYRAQCHAKGWTRLYRPPVSFTNSLKKLQMNEYGYPLVRIRDSMTQADEDRRVARYVVRILHGAKTAGLPVEHPRSSSW